MLRTKTLYSLDKAGKQIEWTIKWDDQDNWYTMASGRTDGAITETKPTYCTGKSKGKRNETTDVQQCAKEVEARIEKQKKKDFHDEPITEKRFEVTLAKEFNARKKFIKFPMLVSAKIDGFRCYITKDGMFSRTHHKIVSCPHIFDELIPFFKRNPHLILDGELYSHELKDDFNRIAALLSRTKNLTDDFLDETASVIKFHLFDMYDRSDIQNYTYKDRCSILLSEAHNGAYDFISQAIGFTHQLKYFNIVKQFYVNSFDDVENIIDKAIDMGFEGVMLRNPKMGYENGRSSNLIKYKKFKDAEYEIVDICEGLGNSAGMGASIICKDGDKQFSIGFGKGWDEPAKREIFENKENYIGKLVTVVFQELTPDEKVPRFGKAKTIRDNGF